MSNPNRVSYHNDPERGLVPSHICACHGREFNTKMMMELHVKQYHKAIRDDLETMVRENALGCNPWDRLPGETVIQYSRFQTYLNSTDPKTKKRSIYRVAAALNLHIQTVTTLCSTHKWRYRADLMDAHIEKEEIAEFIKAKAASARRQARVGQKLQSLAMAGAQAYLSDPDRVAEMTGHEIAKLAVAGTNIERLANSDPTQISEDRTVGIIWDGPRPPWAPPEPEEETKATPAIRNVTPKLLEGEK